MGGIVVRARLRPRRREPRRWLTLSVSVGGLKRVQWSGNTHHLRKEEHGFAGEIPGLKFDHAYDYKYVVDGTWQIRDDEAKSWGSSIV